MSLIEAEGDPAPATADEAPARAGGHRTPPEGIGTGTQRVVTKEAIELIQANPELDTHELLTKLQAELGLTLSMDQVRHAHWYYVLSKSRDQTQAMGKGRDYKNNPNRKRGPGRKPDLHPYAFQYIRDNPDMKPEEIAAHLGPRGIHLHRRAILRHLYRAREIRSIERGEVAPHKGSLSEFVLNQLIAGHTDTKKIVSAAFKAGFKNAAEQSVYGIRSRYRVHLENHGIQTPGAPTPRPRVPEPPIIKRKAEVPATQPRAQPAPDPRLRPAPRAPEAEPAEQSKDPLASVKAQIRVMCLRYGLDTVAGVVDEMKHILEKTEAKI